MSTLRNSLFMKYNRTRPTRDFSPKLKYPIPHKLEPTALDIPSGIDRFGAFVTSVTIRSIFWPKRPDYDTYSYIYLFFKCQISF